MNKFKFYFISILTTLILFSCTKNNNDTTYTPEPLRDFTAQHKLDNEAIVEYLQKNYITVVDKPGQPDDQDVTIAPLDATNTVSIWNQEKYALITRTVLLHGLNYTLYYLVLREGTGESPCNTDGVFAAYSGSYLSKTTATPSVISATEFQTVRIPQTFFDLYTTIKGWSEVFPQFKTGKPELNDDGTIKNTDFGAGVLFIPSGLGYFSAAQTAIPAYSPLVFSFKLFGVKRLDHEFYNTATSQGVFSTLSPDGIFDYQEGLDADKYAYDYRDNTLYPTKPAADVLYKDDTDKDGIPDFLDLDDDGDGFTTKLEIKNTKTGLPLPFNEIPTCASGKKNYLDATCHP
jgi:hypothetical protein